MLKLTFHVSTPTALDNKTLLSNISGELSRRGYNRVETTGDQVIFSDSPWKFTSRSKALSRFHGGHFKIETTENLKVVRFSFYLSVLAPILILLALSCFLIKDRQYYAPLFFLAFYFIGTVVNVIILRSAARDLLESVVK